MKFLILGASGMAGHTISIYLQEQGHDVTTFTLEPFSFGKNIIGNAVDQIFLQKIIFEGQYDSVINCIGLLNQDAEISKHNAIYLNSYLPHYLSYITMNSITKIIHMSTDCVFSGKTGRYDENSFKDGESFYDRSKSLGEIINHKDLTFRNSIIGPDINQEGIGLFNWFMKQEGKINGFTKAIWTGVTTLTLAKAMERALLENITGIYHLVNNINISKYDLLKLFNKHMKDNRVLIQPSEKVSVNKSLVNNRNDFPFVVPSYEEMIIEMKEWIKKHKEIYPHYFL